MGEFFVRVVRSYRWTTYFVYVNGVSTWTFHVKPLVELKVRELEAKGYTQVVDPWDHQ